MHPAATRQRFSKQGPKRLRRSRRELPEGGYGQWGHCWTHFKRERAAALLALRTADQLAAPAAEG